MIFTVVAHWSIVSSFTCTVIVIVEHKCKFGLLFLRNNSGKYERKPFAELNLRSEVYKPDTYTFGALIITTQLITGNKLTKHLNRHLLTLSQVKDNPWCSELPKSINKMSMIH